MSDPLFFAPLRVPFTDPETGIISRPWQLLLQGIFNRIGGTSGLSSDELAILANENADIAATESVALREKVADALLLASNALDDAGFAASASSAAPVMTQVIGAAWVSSGGAIVVPVNAVPRTVSGAFTIKEVIILTVGGSGSCVVNVWKANLSAHYPPVITDDITGGTSPAISGGVVYQNSTLAGWTLALAQDDVLLFTLASSSVFTFVSIQIRIG